MVAASFVSHGQEVDRRTPLQKYQGAAFFGATVCDLKFQLSQSRGDATGEADYGGCIQEQRTAVKAAYDAALKMVKKPAAQKALKEHYIAVISQLNGIRPESDELRIHYTKRQNDNKVRVQELWTRFELEQ